MNIHFDYPLQSLTKHTLTTLSLHSLVQVINKPTHRCGHIIDWVIVRPDDDIHKKSSVTDSLVLGGDFNLPHINWKKKSIKAGSNQHMQHQQLLDMEQELGFEQMQLSPSRESNILDLYFTTYPSLVKSCYTVPGISDHHMVVVDCDVKPRYKKQKHRQ